MRVFEWKNKEFDEADLFVEFTDEEAIDIDTVFPDYRKACERVEGYYAFVNTKNKTLSPLRLPSYAFGGGYNDNGPIGDEIKDATVDVKALIWKPYTQFEEQERERIRPKYGDEALEEYSNE